MRTIAMITMMILVTMAICMVTMGTVITPTSMPIIRLSLRIFKV